MSYYPGDRQGGDSYRPSDSRGYGHHSSGQNSSRGRFQQHDNRGSHYRPNQGRGGYQSYQGTQGGQGRPNRYQQGRQGGTHSIYSQTQPENQLWMGDLDPLWNEETIVGFWNQVGEAPTNVKIMRDKTGKPSYCFVTFPGPREVANAIQKNSMVVPGTNRHFKLNYAAGGRSGPNAPNQRGEQGSRSSVYPQNEWSVFVGDLATSVTEQILYNHFSKEYPGAVRQVRIMTEYPSRVSKGYGFVRFNNEESQQHALQHMNGTVMAGRVIRVGQAAKNDTGDRKTVESSVPETVKLNQYHPPLGPFTDPNNTVIKVKGVTPSITRDELLGHFLPFGHIIYCRVNYRESVAHIKFLNRREAESAMLYMYGFIINNCRVALRWGRDEKDEAGKVAFQPGEKTDSYNAAKEAPLYVGNLDTNVVFEDLSKEEVKALQFHSQDEYLTFAEVDERERQHKKERDEYLDSAF